MQLKIKHFSEKKLTKPKMEVDGAGTEEDLLFADDGVEDAEYTTGEVDLLLGDDEADQFLQGTEEGHEAFEGEGHEEEGHEGEGEEEEGGEDEVSTFEKLFCSLLTLRQIKLERLARGRIRTTF